MNEIESILKVEHREVRTALNAIEKIIDERERVTILFGDSIQPSIVDTET